MGKDVEAGGKAPPDLGSILRESGAKGVVDALMSLPIAVVGRQTCAYSIEAIATLVDAAAVIGGADALTIYWTNAMPDGVAVHTALKEELKQATVPYVFINGEFIGGCDATKKLLADGMLAPKLYAAAATHGLATSARIKTSPPKAADAHNGEAHDAPIEPDETFVDAHFKPSLGDATSRAYTVFWFPEVVDSNVVRGTAVQVVTICILGIVFRQETWAHYMILALALDNLLRLLYGPGPSPLSQLARCITAFTKPVFRPGVPKQFAAFCGLFMSVVATAFFFASGFDSREIIPACFLAVYGALAFLEAAFDFCMGCWMFGILVQLRLLPPEIYAIGISSKPEFHYAYEEATKRMELPDTERVRLSYPNKPPTSIDPRYKVKSNDHDRQSFNVIKHTKILHFNIVLAFCGLAAVWRLAAHPMVGGAAGMSISNAPGDVLAIFSVIVYGIFAVLYATKVKMHPHKVAMEWMCPLRSNAFIVPPACFVLLAFVTVDRFDGADTLAKVLFWIGAPITLVLAIYIAALWITDAHSQEHINAAWMLPPVACFVCALVAPFLQPSYTEAAYLWFSFAAALSLPLFIITFHKAIVFNDPDDRNRPMKWTWVAAPAVACVAQVVLNAFTPVKELGIDRPALEAAMPALAFDFISRTLYFVALSLSLILALLFLTPHASKIKFDPISSWGIAFPLEALTLATLIYAAAVQGDLPRGMGYAGLFISSVTVLLCVLHSLQNLFMGQFFVADAKYGPLSQQILTHEAFRAAGARLKVAVAALAPSGPACVNPPALSDFALQFRRYRLAHAWHAEQEEAVIFREFEAYVPGLCSRQHTEHSDHDVVMARWGDAIEALEDSLAGEASDAKDVSDSLNILTSEVPVFIDEFEAHLSGEEEHLQRAGRKHMNLDLSKQMIRKIWETTPVAVWAEFMPFVVSNLPMNTQRVKFVRCWATWAVPERAQLIGRMIALGVDAPTWERLVQSVPEIIPRGARGWRKLF